MRSLCPAWVIVARVSHLLVCCLPQNLQNIRDTHRHPTDYFDYSKLFANLAAAEQDGLEVWRIYIQMYVDAFPILSGRKNASSNAIYMSFGNLDQEELQKLENYFCIGHFPKGVNKHECFKVWLTECAQLQDGFRHTFPTIDKTVFICGGIGIGKFDMPEAQSQAGALQQGADFPDRMSYASKGQLDDLKTDLRLKTLDHVRDKREEQALNPRDAGVRRGLQQVGMHEQPSWFEGPGLHFDVTQQIPPQTCHSELLGVGGKALTLFLSELTPLGRQALNDAMETQVLPPHWDTPGALRLSINGSLQCGVEDIRRHLQLLPFAIHGMLKLPPRKSTLESKLEAEGRLTFTDKALEKYRKRQQGRRSGTTDLFAAFVAVAWSQKHTLARARRSGSPTEDLASLEELDAAVLAGRAALLKNWPDDFNVPNFLTGRHYKRAVELFGVPAALNLCMEEMNHNLYKLRVCLLF